MKQGAGRGVLGVVLFLFVVVVLLGLTVFFTESDSDRSEPLDPQGWRNPGGHALAELVRQHGMELSVVRTAHEAQAATRQDTVLFITNSSGT